MSMDAARVSASTASTTSGGASQRVTVSPGFGSTGHAPRSPEAGTGGAPQRAAGPGGEWGAVLAIRMAGGHRPAPPPPPTRAPAPAPAPPPATPPPPGPR